MFDCPAGLKAAILGEVQKWLFWRYTDERNQSAF
jgi:hypothetical protein